MKQRIKQRIYLMGGVVALSMSLHTNAVANQGDAPVASIGTFGTPPAAEQLQLPQITMGSSRTAVIPLTEHTDNRQAANESPSAMDIWLMIITGAGLVVLQLRRKQKALPQQPIILDDSQVSGEHTSQQRTDVVANIPGHS